MMILNIIIALSDRDKRAVVRLPGRGRMVRVERRGAAAACRAHVSGAARRPIKSSAPLAVRMCSIIHYAA